VTSPSNIDDGVREPQDSLESLFEDFLRRAADRNGGAAPNLRDWVELAEAWRITHALRECRGNRSAAARALGIGRRTLYSKMEKLKIEPVYSPWGQGEERRAS
jgi:DNA-binding NtrC family response regulator